MEPEQQSLSYVEINRRITAFAALFLSSEARETLVVEQRLATASSEQDCWDEFPNICYTVREPLFVKTAAQEDEKWL